MTTMPLLHKLKEELIAVVPAVIYFCITFNIIEFAEGLMLAPYQPRIFNHLSITLGALVVGKVLLIVNALPIVNAFPKKPLIYNIIWKFFLYSTFVVIIKMTEIFIRVSYHTGSYQIAFAHLQFALQSAIFWSIAIMFFLVLFIFVVVSEFVHALGQRRVLHMLFGLPE